MAQEYIVIKEKTEQSGLIALSKSVFESIAKISVEEVEGCFLVDNSKKAVVCKIINNRLHVNVEAKVKYGVNVNRTCEDIQDRITQNIQLMTNLKCGSVDVKISGFVF
ncbi:MAG: Asp23/Gls24 family envelope stress response protein [Erysipelotrichaceae bacterium]|nr:Asp23/Gls24 family envelope stress response protein [Erysipelotrichaceae bacterium]